MTWRCISRTNIDFGRTCEKAAAALQLPVIVYGKESGENSEKEEKEEARPSDQQQQQDTHKSRIMGSVVESPLPSLSSSPSCG